ncbi:MAG: glucose-1-phosphate adenylyltransferase [Magnetococcus sp. WYHC-3]
MASVPSRELDLNREMKHVLALILAGGKGTRLRNLTHAQAKPAVPFGGKFRIVDFTLSNCVNSGIRRIGVLTQYRAHTLIQHVQRGWGFLRAEFNEFIEVWPAQQQTESESWYSGTADAIYQNLDMIESHQPDYVLILGGDHIYKQDYSQMLAEHIRKGAEITVACIDVPKEDAKAFGVVEIDQDGVIQRFVEKSPDPPTIPGQPDRCLASMGIYIFNINVLLVQLCRDASEPDSDHDFGKNILPHCVSRMKVLAHNFTSSCISNRPGEEPYWRDVGTVDAYYDANMDLVSVTPQLDLYDENWPIWTYQVQRPGAKFVFDDNDRRGMAVDSVVSAGCIISGSVVRRSLLFTNVRVNSYCTIEDSIMLTGCDIGRGCRLKKVIVAPDCEVPDGLVVGEDSAEDERRFHRTPGGVVLIVPEDLAKLK